MLIVADQNTQFDIDPNYREFIGWSLLSVVVGTVIINLIKALLIDLFTFVAYFRKKFKKKALKNPLETNSIQTENQTEQEDNNQIDNSNNRPETLL